MVVFCKLVGKLIYFVRVFKAAFALFCLTGGKTRFETRLMGHASARLAFRFSLLSYAFGAVK